MTRSYYQSNPLAQTSLFINIANKHPPQCHLSLVLNTILMRACGVCVCVLGAERINSTWNSIMSVVIAIYAYSHEPWALDSYSRLTNNNRVISYYILSITLHFIRSDMTMLIMKSNWPVVCMEMNCVAYIYIYICWMILFDWKVKMEKFTFTLQYPHTNLLRITQTHSIYAHVTGGDERFANLKRNETNK